MLLTCDGQVAMFPPASPLVHIEASRRGRDRQVGREEQVWNGRSAGSWEVGCVIMSKKLLGESARPGHGGPGGGYRGDGRPCATGAVSPSPETAGGSGRAKEATVSRAKGRTGVWRVAALLTGALTQLAVGRVLAQPQLGLQPAGRAATGTGTGAATGADAKAT